MHQDDFAPEAELDLEAEFTHPGITDIGVRIQYSIMNGEGSTRPFLSERHPNIESAQNRLMDLAQDPYDNGMKGDEDIVFQVVPDA